MSATTTALARWLRRGLQRCERTQVVASVYAGGRTGDESLIQELLEESRRMPDEWKLVVVEQMAQFRRLAEPRPVRTVGADEAQA